MKRNAVVLGAGRVGGAVIDRLLADGWAVTGVAHSAATLAAIRGRGAAAVEADARDQMALRAALDHAADVHGRLDLVVNAIASPVPSGPFGGGAIAETDVTAVRRWTVGVVEQTFTVLHSAANALRTAGGGTIVQLTGASSLRAAAGRGPWAAGAFGTRALVQAAAQELAPDGVHVALLIVEGQIGDAAERQEIAAAVAFLADPGVVRRPYELVLSRAGS